MFVQGTAKNVGDVFIDTVYVSYKLLSRAQLLLWWPRNIA